MKVRFQIDTHPKPPPHSQPVHTFPYKMIIDLLLLCCISIQVILYSNNETKYYRDIERVFKHSFLLEPPSNKVYSINEIRNYFQQALNNYYILQTQSLFTTEHIEPNITMKVYYDTTSFNTVIPLQSTYIISSPHNYGPFNASYSSNDIKHYLDHINKFTLHFNITTPPTKQQSTHHHLWQIHLNFMYTHQTYFDISLHVIPKSLSNSFSITTYFHILPLCLTILRIYISHPYCNNNAFTTTLTAFQFVTSLLLLFTYTSSFSFISFLLAFTCMFTYIHSSVYLHNSFTYQTIYSTLYYSLPKVISFLVGVVPVFGGFVFFGLSVFYSCEAFQSTSNASQALFALMNGDSIYDISHQLKGMYFVLGQVYSYTFCVLFIVVVMNVFISIIQEAYVYNGKEKGYEWELWKYLKMEDNMLNKRDDKYDKRKDVRERGIIMWNALNKCEMLCGKVNCGWYEVRKLNKRIGEVERKVKEIMKLVN